MALAATGAKVDAIEECITSAYRIATEQGALFSRLRVALDAARIRTARGSPDPDYDELSAALASLEGAAATQIAAYPWTGMPLNLHMSHKRT